MHILGTPGNDQLYGTPEDDVLLGLAGNDGIYDRRGPGSATVCAALVPILI